MKKILTAALLGSLALPVLAVAPAQAQADTPGCVTRAEYRQVHKGDSRTRVNRIFDTSGTRQAHASSGGFHTEVRSYNTCSQFSAVSIAFDKRGQGLWKLSAKSAVWVG